VINEVNEEPLPGIFVSPGFSERTGDIIGVSAGNAIGSGDWSIGMITMSIIELYVIKPILVGISLELLPSSNNTSTEP
jgi:hypothetical protein